MSQWGQKMFAGQKAFSGQQWPSPPEPGPSYIEEVLADSPEALWLLDETSGSTAADSSSNGHHATWAATPTLAVDGPGSGLPLAARLNGTSHQASTGNLAAFNFSAASAWTVATWAKWTATTGTRQAIGIRTSPSAPTFGSVTNGIAVNNPSAGDVLVYAANSANSGAITAPAAGSWNDDDWHHLALVSVSGGDLILYVDGTVEATNGSARSTTTQSRSVMIGHRQGDQFFAGDLAGLVVVKSALSQARIQAHIAAAL